LPPQYGDINIMNRSVHKRSVHIIAKCRRHGAGSWRSAEDQIYLGCMKNRFTVFYKREFHVRGLYMSAICETEGVTYTCTISGCVVVESVCVKFSESHPKITITVCNSTSGHLLQYLIYRLCLQLFCWKKQPFGIAYYRLQKQATHSIYMDETFKIVAKCIHSSQASVLDIKRV
jgi:hypothetical protein